MESQFHQFHTKIVKNTHGDSGGVRGAQRGYNKTL